MAVEERDDDAVERAVRFLEPRCRAVGLERAAPRDVRDLGHEARAEEEEDLRRLSERELPPRSPDAVLASELRRLAQQLIAPAALRVERAQQELAHAHAPLAEPPQRGFIEARVPVLIG